jgi:hypothetical protein
MAEEFEAELFELLGLRLLRAFENLRSDQERHRIVEYVEALSHQPETKAGSALRLVPSDLERAEQDDFFPGKTI